MIVSKDGKLLDPSLYEWNKETVTFKSSKSGLTIDCSNDYFAKINCENNCIIRCHSNCIINCGDFCTIISDEQCKISTRSYCNIYTTNDSVVNCRDNCQIETQNAAFVYCGDDCVIISRPNSVIMNGNDCILKYYQEYQSKHLFLTPNKCTKLITTGIEILDHLTYKSVIVNNNWIDFNFTDFYNLVYRFYYPGIDQKELVDAFRENNHTKLLMMENESNKRLIKTFIMNLERA